MKKFDLDKYMDSFKNKDAGYNKRTIPFAGGKVVLFYITQLTDRTLLTESVLSPLMSHCSSSKKPINAQMTMDEIIYVDECKIESDVDKIEENILSGKLVLLFSNDTNYIVVNLRKVESRGIPTPQLSYTVRGPQDCFTECIDANLSLIRYRMNSENLKIKNYEVGNKTKTCVAVIYVDDVASDVVVNELDRRINNIDIDGICESGELQMLLSENKLQLFPEMGLVERSDMAFHALLKGKVLVLVDGSGIALLTPRTFSEFFYSGDDRYDNKLFGLFSRILRYLSIIIAITASSVYVALVSFHTDALPTKYAVTLSEMRSNVPFSALIGAIALEFVVELLREALIRIPKHIGPAIGIVGAIIVGQAAIAAGIFSPLLLIIVSMALLASFAIPDYSLVNPFRVLKFILLIFTGTLGFFGFTILLTFILAELVALDSFGMAYMTPWAPYNAKKFKKSFVNDIKNDKQRKSKTAGASNKKPQ